MLFSLISIILVPAITFREIAVRSNKKGWVFFLIGLGVGLITLTIVSFLSYLLMQFEIVAKGEDCVSFLIVFVALPTLIVAIAVIWFRSSMLGNPRN